MYTQNLLVKNYTRKVRSRGEMVERWVNFIKKLNDIGHKSFGIESEVNTWTSRVTWIETRQQMTDLNSEIATFYDQLT